MGTQAGVGQSVLSEPGEAARAAVRAACMPLDGPPELVLLFGTAGYDQQALVRAARAEASGARIAGCSGEGIIALGDSVERHFAVAAMAIRSDVLSFETLLLSNYSCDPVERGRELGRRVSAWDDAIGVLLLVDGLRGNCTDLLGALEETIRPGVAVVGGTSADGFLFEENYQYEGDRAASDAVAAVVVRGRGHVELAVSHGCMPVGRPRVVTRAEGGWVHEIDGRPAWSVFREYLDGDPRDLNAEGIVQLCIGEELPPDQAERYAPYVIRTPLSLDQATGALFFPGGSVYTNQRIQLTRRDPLKIRDSARACASQIVERNASQTPAFVVQFDCAGRGRILFGADAAAMIVHPLQEALGSAVPWIGVHTYGEIAPIGSKLYYHNYTVALCAVYDGAPTAGVSAP